MLPSIFGPFTLVSFGANAPKTPATPFDTLDAAKAAVAALAVPEGARVLIMGNMRTPIGTVRCPVT
jgi:hypothetical protein